MADRATKVLLGLIAAGLWINAIGAWVRPAQAADVSHLIQLMYPIVKNIQEKVGEIGSGSCSKTRAVQ